MKEVPEGRKDLNWKTLPERMKSLPIDSRGYPVPWFVAWIDNPDKPGEKMPEFRAMDPRKYNDAIRYDLCWVCGKKRGSFMTFTIGPMCGINRITSEPPSHLECAQWSAKNCPFLSKPQMERRESGPGLDPEKLAASTKNVAGVMIERNPGVTLLWTCRSFHQVPDGKGKTLIRIGDPEHVEFYTKGRLATRAEVEMSVESGIPLLLKACDM